MKERQRSVRQLQGFQQSRRRASGPSGRAIWGRWANVGGRRPPCRVAAIYRDIATRLTGAKPPASPDLPADHCNIARLGGGCPAPRRLRIIGRRPAAGRRGVVSWEEPLPVRPHNASSLRYRDEHAESVLAASSR